ncbi:Odorant binding protein, partial [Operophtera brumata]
LGNSEPLLECSNPKLPGPVSTLQVYIHSFTTEHHNRVKLIFYECNDVQCVFEKSGFLTGNTLNKEAYRNHLLQWSESHKDWSKAVEKAIKD